MTEAGSRSIAFGPPVTGQELCTNRLYGGLLWASPCEHGFPFWLPERHNDAKIY
jgi:hypothetical protein